MWWQHYLFKTMPHEWMNLSVSRSTRILEVTPTRKRATIFCSFNIRRLPLNHTMGRILYTTVSWCYWLIKCPPSYWWNLWHWQPTKLDMGFLYSIAHGFLIFDIIDDTPLQIRWIYWTLKAILLGISKSKWLQIKDGIQAYIKGRLFNSLQNELWVNPTDISPIKEVKWPVDNLREW